MSGVTFKAKRERFCTVLHFNDGSCRPASDVELECLARIAELEARNKRLEEALSKIAGLNDLSGYEDHCSAAYGHLAECEAIASAALSTKEDGT